MAPSLEVPSPQAPELGFSISHQKVELDIDLPTQSLRGRTEIVVNPHSKDLKTMRLNCRQCVLSRLMVNNKPCPGALYQDPYSHAKLPWKASVHQYHMLEQKLEGQLRDPPDEELLLHLPKSIKIDELDPFSEEAQGILLSKTLGKKDSRAETIAAIDLIPSTRNGVEQAARFTPIRISIDYIVKRIRDGMHFVGWAEGDLRYPHAYTTNSLSPGAACCLFPCTDDLTSRSTWEISIKCQKTVGDAFQSVSNSRMRNQSDGNNGNPIGSSGRDQCNNFTDEDNALDLAVICTGDLTDEIIDPRDPTKKTTSFTCTTPISAQHIGFAIGPFEHIDLAEFRESDQDEKLGQNAVPVHGFCLPGRADETKNTCLPLAKAMDFFALTYGSYPFSNYKLCFVDDLSLDIVDTGSLSICSNRLLFPEDVIEPLYQVSRQLVHALSVQWMGINIVPKDSSDFWVIIGIAYFMTDIFMKKLSGNNEYRFNQKKAADRVVELDIARPSLLDTGPLITLDPLELEFMELKAPLVLFILDRRLTKAGGWSGLSRIISRIFLNAKIGDLPNGALDSASFVRVCEKLGHLKLDTFFAQWVEGAGCPRFRVTQRFNKKKLVVEMLIQQIQAEPTKDRDLESSTFMRDVKEDQVPVYAGAVQQAFTGPMTIRIHEADGTPYEHIIEIKEAKTTFDIPYNTKYKRLKRSRRQRERTAVVPGPEYAGGVGDDVLLYSLGDVLQSEEDMREWDLSDWSKDDEEKMSQESYEWIRMDADFEWICKMNVQMQSYMWVSQLQQDRDVVAQLESIQWMSLVQPHPLVSTILIRTVMDQRYFHGIRTAAAEVLTRNARDELKWIGRRHLEKAFQELFCYPDSAMTRSNDFSDRTLYYIQCAIPQAISKIRNADGRSPFEVRKFLYEKLKFNDNSYNEYSDCHYLASLMKALAEALAARPTPTERAFDDFEDDGDNELFHNACLDEIDRYRRIDEWIPSYHNVLSTTALDCKRMLARAGIINTRPEDFLQYTPDGTSDCLRVKAFGNLMALGLIKNDAILRWFMFVLGTDPSPYIRDNMLRIFEKTLGAIAIGDDSEIDKAQVARQDGLVIEQESSTEARQADLARKQTIQGALNALKAEISANSVLKTELWNAITSPTLSLQQMGDLIDICELLYTPDTSMVVVLKYPRYWTCHKIGKGKMLFSPSSRIRLTPLPKRQVLPLVQHPSQPTPSYKNSIASNAMLPPLRLKFAPPKKHAPPSTPSTVSLDSMPASREGSLSGEAPKPKLKLSFNKLKGSASGVQGSPTP